MLLDYNEKILCPSEVQVESEEISACSPFTPEAASVCLTYSLIIIKRLIILVRQSLADWLNFPACSV
jgi:hypothetical protein